MVPGIPRGAYLVHSSRFSLEAVGTDLTCVKGTNMMSSGSSSSLSSRGSGSRRLSHGLRQFSAPPGALSLRHRTLVVLWSLFTGGRGYFYFLGGGKRLQEHRTCWGRTT